MGEFTVRPAVEADAGLVFRFVGELAEFERLPLHPEATEESLRAALFGPVPAAEALLAFEGTEPVGFALFFRTYSTFRGRPGVYLEDLYVSPHARGRGAGRALLRRLAALAVERDCGRLEWAVLDWNERAIRFYESLGARPMGEWTVYRLTGDDLGRFASEPG